MTHVSNPEEVDSIRAIATSVLHDPHHADPALPEKAIWLAQAVLDLTTVAPPVVAA